MYLLLLYCIIEYFECVLLARVRLCITCARSVQSLLCPLQPCALMSNHLHVPRAFPIQPVYRKA